MAVNYVSYFDRSMVITKRELCKILNLNAARPGLIFTVSEIKQAYRKRALRFHPDRQNRFESPIPTELCNALISDAKLARDYLLANKTSILGRPLLLAQHRLATSSKRAQLKRSIRKLFKLIYQLLSWSGVISILDREYFIIAVTVLFFERLAAYASHANSKLEVFLTKILSMVQNLLRLGFVTGLNILNHFKGTLIRLCLWGLSKLATLGMMLIRVTIKITDHLNISLSHWLWQFLKLSFEVIKTTWFWEPLTKLSIAMQWVYAKLHLDDIYTRLKALFLEWSEGSEKEVDPLSASGDPTKQFLNKHQSALVKYQTNEPSEPSSSHQSFSHAPPQDVLPEQLSAWTDWTPFQQLILNDNDPWFEEIMKSMRSEPIQDEPNIVGQALPVNVL